MSLINVGGSNTYTWYKNANGNMSDYSTYTSGDFGKGKENTTKMITKWKANGYGTGESTDVWSVVQGEVAKGWFVPSRGEWAAFANELGITSSNYTSRGLSSFYWSSSQRTTRNAWSASFRSGYMLSDSVDSNRYVRLGTTF